MHADREKLFLYLSTSKLPVVLRDEMNWQREHAADNFPDTPFDDVDAFWSADENADVTEDRALQRACREVLVTVGYYRPMDENEIRNTITTGKPWAFKKNRIAYTSDYSRNWR